MVSKFNQGLSINSVFRLLGAGLVAGKSQMDVFVHVEDLLTQSRACGFVDATVAKAKIAFGVVNVPTPSNSWRGWSRSSPCSSFSYPKPTANVYWILSASGTSKTTTIQRFITIILNSHNIAISRKNGLWFGFIRILPN